MRRPTFYDNRRPSVPLVRNAFGFGGFEMIVGVGIIVAIGFVIWQALAIRPSETNQAAPIPTPAAAEDAGEPPALQSLAGIVFGPFDAKKGISGDVVMNKAAADQTGLPNLTLVPFATRLCKGVDCRTLPEIGMHGLKLGTKVLSSGAGTVMKVEQQDDDYEILIDAGGRYVVGYDHVLRPAVAAGDKVRPGDLLGEVAPYGNALYGRVELYVKRVGAQGDNDSVYVCPVDLLDVAARKEVTAQLSQFFVDWNGVIGVNAYVAATMSSPGCNKPELKYADSLK